MATYKGVEIDTKPTEAMAEEAQRGLDWRAEFGRGGTEIGVARARDLVNRRELSLDTVGRMASFFARHAVDKQAEGFSPGEEGYPSAGRIAWALWGGDPGESWANERVGRMESADNQDRDIDENKESALISAQMEESMDQEQRHIVAVTETENSFVVEFAKAEMPEAEELVEEMVEDEIEVELVENSYGDRKGEPLTLRADSMEPVIEDERRVRMAISSELPVERMGGMEILDHSASSIDLSFLNSGRAPLLLDHDPTQQIGVVESVTLDESARKLRATVRFGKNGRASEVYDDVVDGIRGNVSIGYYVKKVTRESDGKVYRATSWQPLEVSVVSIPADPSVGVGRSAMTSQPVIEVISNSNPKGTEMSQENTGAVTAEAAIAKRNAELKQISELAARHNKTNLVAQAIERGMSYGEFQGFLLERNLDKPLHAPDVEMTKTEQKRYSLLRAIDSIAKHGRVTGYEAEISDEIARNTGKQARGFFVPMSVFAKRDILTTSPANGSNIIAEDYMAGEFIDRLRANLVIGNLGARMMTGLKGDVAIPKMGTGSTVAFVGENSAPSESAQTFTQVTMSPKTLASFTDISRKLAIQSDPSVEQIIREDILQSFARKIDEVAIEGGGANEPTGILGTNGIGSVAIGTNGGAITFASLVNLEREVAIDNALMGNLAFLTNPKVVAAMRNRPRQTSGVEGNFILNDTNVLLGYNVASTTLVPSDLTKGTSSGVCSAVIFGNFSDLMIGMWNSPDVLVDPYTGSSAGTIRIAAFQEVDVKVRHAESFAAIKDVTTA